MKAKDIRKSFKYVNPFYWINRRKNRERYLIVLAAKYHFISNRNANYNTGLCHSFNVVITEYMNDCDANITDIIPEFNREFLNATRLTDVWWWCINDYNSRIRAFDKLLEYYKNRM